MTNDLRVGGRYRLEVGRTVVTNFEGKDSSTRVTTVFDAEKENPEEMQKAGWQAILNNFKKYADNAAVSAGFATK